jgi:hypothetical protein
MVQPRPELESQITEKTVFSGTNLKRRNKASDKAVRYVNSGSILALRFSQ